MSKILKFESVNDVIAQKLEAAGFWRRAADRWLEVMVFNSLSDAQREWIRSRRKYCLLETVGRRREDSLNVMEILRAAKITQKRMGLSQPNGAAFRMNNRKRRTKEKPIDYEWGEDAESLIIDHFGTK